MNPQEVKNGVHVNFNGCETICNMTKRSLVYQNGVSLIQIDLGKRRVDESEGRLWAETHGFLYYETSAQTGENVSDMFEVN